MFILIVLCLGLENDLSPRFCLFNDTFCLLILILSNNGSCFYLLFDYLYLFFVYLDLIITLPLFMKLSLILLLLYWITLRFLYIQLFLISFIIKPRDDSGFLLFICYSKFILNGCVRYWLFYWSLFL